MHNKLDCFEWTGLFDLVKLYRNIKRKGIKYFDSTAIKYIRLNKFSWCKHRNARRAPAHFQIHLPLYYVPVLGYLYKDYIDPFFSP